MNTSRFLRDLLVPAVLEVGPQASEAVGNLATEYLFARRAQIRDDAAYDALCAVAGEQIHRLETPADVDGFLVDLACAAEADV